MMDGQIQLRLEMTQAEADDELSAAMTGQEFKILEKKSLDPGQLPPLVEAAFIEPISLVAVATLAFVVERVVNHWLRGKEQGVQIDLREKPPIISRLAGVPYGFLVIINADGTATTHKADYSQGQNLSTLLQTVLAGSPGAT